MLPQARTHDNTGSAQAFSYLFVSSTRQLNRPILDPSTRYRCYHPAEALVEQGHHCAVTSLAKFLEAPSYDYDVYIFHRPTASKTRFSKIIRTLKQMGRTIIADYDDLVFGDEQTALESSIVKNCMATESEAIQLFKNNREALLQFDVVTASTRPLAHEVREAHTAVRTVQVVPNTIPSSVLELTALYETWRTPRPKQSLGYFCGTKSHNKDFPEIYDVLLRLVQEYPALTLTIFGPLDVSGALRAQPQVFFQPVVGYWRLPFHMSQCHVAVAPLESTRFNACKSRVKFLESCLAGCHLVASPIDDMQLLVDQTITLASTQDEWYRAISDLISEASHETRDDNNFDFVRQSCHSALAASYYSDLTCGIEA